MATTLTALATDYDGTIAHNGIVTPQTVLALERAQRAGVKLILVTGRELPELIGVFPQVEMLFDLVVAENGALLYEPTTKAIRALATPPKMEFAERLRSRGVSRISCGHVIVATWEPHQIVVLETIREMGLELEVIFNKGAVMVLPTGVNKASGLKAALKHLGIDATCVVGVGDAENDHSLLGACGVGVAVANAVPSLKERAHHVMARDHGAGVEELLDLLFELPPPPPSSVHVVPTTAL